VKYLFSIGCDPNKARKKNAATPLWSACHKGNAQIVEFLCSVARCDPNQANSVSASALWLAAQEGHIDVIETLIIHGAKMKASWSGILPVKQAETRGHKELVKFLKLSMEKEMVMKRALRICRLVGFRSAASDARNLCFKLIIWELLKHPFTPPEFERFITGASSKLTLSNFTRVPPFVSQFYKRNN